MGDARRTMQIEKRLELFDAATRRQAVRERGRQEETSEDRGWLREDLYDRGLSRD